MREPELIADTLYVIGGLYGNPYALARILELCADELGDALLVFNGDFNWFDVEPNDFRDINLEVLKHHSLRGNVETELAAASNEAGCGCDYPDWVGDAEVERSNQIMAILRGTARGEPQLTARLSALPMHLVAQIADVRIGIVHGDADALSGWNFSQERLRTAPENATRALEGASVEVFACSHTCLPILHEARGANGGLIINNGAAGMPNFAGTRHGVITRISTRPARRTLYGGQVRGVHVDALSIDYDHHAWLRHFDRVWPSGSPGALSYRKRIAMGPDYRMDQAHHPNSRIEE